MPGPARSRVAQASLPAFSSSPARAKPRRHGGLRHARPARSRVAQASLTAFPDPSPLPGSSPTSLAPRPAPLPSLHPGSRKNSVTTVTLFFPACALRLPPAPNRTGHRPVLLRRHASRRSMSPTGASGYSPLTSSRQSPPARRPAPHPVRHANPWRVPSGRGARPPSPPPRLRFHTSHRGLRPAPRPVRLTSPWRRRPCLRPPTPPTHRPTCTQLRR